MRGHPTRHGGAHSLKDDWPWVTGPSVQTEAPTYKGQSSFKVRAVPMAYEVPPHSEAGLTMGGYHIVAAAVVAPVVAIFARRAKHCNSRGLDGPALHPEDQNLAVGCVWWLLPGRAAAQVLSDSFGDFTPRARALRAPRFRLSGGPHHLGLGSMFFNLQLKSECGTHPGEEPRRA